MRTRFRIWTLSLAAVACGTKPAARDAGSDNGDRTRVTSETSRAEHDTSVHSPTKPAPAAEDGAISDAEAVVLAYYAAINTHDYQRAYADGAAMGRQADRRSGPSRLGLRTPIRFTSCSARRGALKARLVPAT
jgi:hypothetical protein